MSGFKGGFMGSILFVDLSSQRVEIRPLSRDMASKYLGGRGFSSYFLWHQMPANIDPYHEDNPIVIAAGPLNGTPAPSASRLTVSSKSPMTGVLGDTNSGGYYAPELKYAGLDAIVITGRAENPVYLMVEDGSFAIKDASHLWGLNINSAADRLKSENGHDIHTLLIGPAGENLVRYACIVTDGEGVGGRTGIGAVFGSKKLKAVVVRGSMDVQIADPIGFKQAMDEYLESLKNEPWTNVLTRLGTPNLTEHRQKLGIWGAKNFQTALLEDHDAVSGETMNKKYLVKPIGCMGCHVRCRRYSSMTNGTGEKVYFKGPEYETLNAFAAKAFISDPDAIMQAHYLCDEYGMDVHGVGSAVAMCMELFEKGMLTKSDTDGHELNFGNGKALLYFLEQIVKKEGLGELMAEGTYIMGQKLNAEYYSIHIKGLEVDASDPRSLATRSLTYAVSTRGACHLRGNPYIDEFIKPEEAKKYFGTVAVCDVKAMEGKGRMVAWSEDWATISDLLGLCKFAWYRSRNFSMLIKRGLELANRLLVSATGLPMNVEELYRCGERVYNLEKMINLREGVGREADYPPQRFFNEPLEGGPGHGTKLDHNQYDDLLSDYYEARGWDRQTGVPSPEKLKQLSLRTE